MIIYGGTGQCKLVATIKRPTAIIDDTPGLKSPIPGVKIYSDFEECMENRGGQVYFVVAIGNPAIRARLAEKFYPYDMKPMNILHPTSNIDTRYGENIGLQLMAMANVSAGVLLGEQVIVNAGASIDHDCSISHSCEIGPGATLCGEVYMKPNSWVGAGAVVLPRLTIGAGAIVGAGAVVTKDVPAGTTVIGNPAKPILKHRKVDTCASCGEKIYGLGYTQNGKNHHKEC